MIEKLRVLLLENLYPRQIVLKNAFWLYLSEFSSKGLRALVFLLIARILGARNFGILEYLFSFVGLFFLFADFGISTIFIRDYQQKENKEKLINTAFILKFLLSLIFSFLAFLGYFLAKKFDGFLIYSLFVGFYFFQNLESFFENYFIAVQKTEKKFIFNIISSVVVLIFIFIGLLIFRNIFIVALAYFLSIVFGLFFAYILFKKEASLFFKLDLPLIKYYLFNGLPLTLFGLLGYIFFSTDKIILAYLRPIEETGYYSVASRIISVFFVIPSLFYTALFPYLAKKAGENDPRFIRKTFKFFITASILTGFLFSILVFILAPVLVPLIFGSKFMNSILILQVFIWILVFVFPTNFLDLFLISFRRHWLDFGLTAVPAILNIILNFIFIVNYGALGAVYASLIAQALNFFLTLIASIYVLRTSLAK